MYPPQPKIAEALVPAASVQGDLLTVLYRQLCNDAELLQLITERACVLDPLKVGEHLLIARNHLDRAIAQIDHIRP